MFTGQFWKDATERALKTGMQAFVGFVAGAGAFNAWTLDWPTALGFVVGGIALSYASSLSSSSLRGNHDSASLVDTSTQSS